MNGSHGDHKMALSGRVFTEVIPFWRGKMNSRERRLWWFLIFIICCYFMFMLSVCNPWLLLKTNRKRPETEEEFARNVSSSLLRRVPRPPATVRSNKPKRDAATMECNEELTSCCRRLVSWSGSLFWNIRKNEEREKLFKFRGGSHTNNVRKVPRKCFVGKANNKQEEDAES